MTSKERIMMVMRGEGIPDRVPVSIGISEGYPVRFTTGDYLEFFHYNPRPLWKARADTERKFGGDNFIHLNPVLKDEFRIVEENVTEEKKDSVVITKTLHTPKGKLESREQIDRKFGINCLEPYIKSLGDDFEKIPYMLPDPERLDYREYLDAYSYIGESGVLAPSVQAPISWLTANMGGPQNMLMAHFDHPCLLAEFTSFYTDWALRTLESYLAADLPMDVINIGAAEHSTSVSSPEFFELYGAPFLKKLIELEKKHPRKFLLHQHTCGKSREIMLRCHELGMRGFEPIEPPPMGNVNLEEAKKLVGKEMCLKGNIDSINMMYNGTPEAIRETTKRMLETGMPGGRYYCAVADQIPYDTPAENVEAFVETAMEYGRY